MFNQITSWIMNMMVTHGALAVFVGVMIESVIVPIPSPLIIMGAGVLIIPPDLPAIETLFQILTKIVLPGSIASTLGAYLTYGIGYWGGKPAIEKTSKLLGFGWEDVVWMEKKMEGRVSLMIFLLRALPIVPLSLISAAGGVLRIPFITFTVWTFLGSLPRTLILAYLGHLTRDTYQGLAFQFNSFESYASIAIVVIAIAAILWLRKKVRS